MVSLSNDVFHYGIGVPRIIRADNGTENVVIAGLQRFFHADDSDAFAGEKSFMYGKSVTNQVRPIHRIAVSLRY